ncbi:S53 family peptidase [Sulfobacillus harzensis]|uniref:S8 family serine peptidase n=1 Tax=Sulfobacillus harzensis TaxID=2729629 RepID=A0A7Y0L5Z1_9FIRM|nr:S53 family peptidase [Sulfobacillus harzensis]NMP22524.1 S8 family serine peptidase [Sulfobacillus harzensis]
MRLSGHLVPNSRPGGWSTSLIGHNHIEIGVALSPVDFEAAHRAMRDRGRAWSREELSQQHGIPGDVREKLRQWLTSNGLTMTAESPFILWLEGTFEAAERTFDMGFEYRQDGNRRLYRPSREPDVPSWAIPWIAGIVGLENVAQLEPRFRTPTDSAQLANGGQGFFPQDLKTAYSFPRPYDGTGQTIGLLEFSNGYSTSDVQSFWQSMNIPAPHLEFVSVDGTPNDGGVNSYDMEATLDVEWAGAMAPGARLVVYEASSGTSDQAFGASVLKALDYAIHDTTHKPSVLSISYGDGESRFPTSEMKAWDAAMQEGALLGITTFVASGDQGAYGLHGMGWPIPHVDAPANCPHAVAVGGTHLVLNANGSIQSETGWTDTNNNGASGGGISQVFAVPSYQSGLSLPVKAGDKPGRGVPDVAANADPDTGYAVVFQGSPTVIGGTSAACPLWAALAACINQARTLNRKGPLGFANPDLYNLGGTSAFHDITSGNNSYNMVEGYQCGPGWDAVTGWGSPEAIRLTGELS